MTELFKHISNATLVKLHPSFGFGSSPDYINNAYGIGKAGSFIPGRHPSRNTQGNSCAADTYFGWYGPSDQVRERLHELYKLSTGVTTAILNSGQNGLYSALLLEEGWVMASKFENQAHGHSTCYLWVKVHHPLE